MEDQLYIVFPSHSFSQSSRLCYRVTPKSGVSLQILIVSRLVKQISAFHGSFKVSYLVVRVVMMLEMILHSVPKAFEQKVTVSKNKQESQYYKITTFRFTLRMIFYNAFRHPKTYFTSSEIYSFLAYTSIGLVLITSARENFR